MAHFIGRAIRHPQSKRHKWALTKLILDLCRPHDGFILPSRAVSAKHRRDSPPAPSRLFLAGSHPAAFMRAGEHLGYFAA